MDMCCPLSVGLEAQGEWSCPSRWEGGLPISLSFSGRVTIPLNFVAAAGMPGESQGWGSLVGCGLWGRTESDTTEVTLQYSCLENPMDRGV